MKNSYLKLKKNRNVNYDDFEKKLEAPQVIEIDLDDINTSANDSSSFRDDQLSKIHKKHEKKVHDPFNDNMDNLNEPVIINQNKVIIDEKAKNNFLKFSVNEGMQARDNEVVLNKNPSTLSNTGNITSKAKPQIGKNSSRYQKKRRKNKKKR